MILEPHFNGPEYNPEQDHSRLLAQHQRIKNLMLDGQWRTLNEIRDELNIPPSSISAQLRHLRKPRFGGYKVDKRAKGSRYKGLFEYRIDTKADFILGDFHDV